MSKFKINLDNIYNGPGLAIAQLQNNNFVVVWPSSTNKIDIHAQILNISGVKVGSEFIANTHISSVKGYPSVSGLSDGKFVIIWDSNNQYAYNSNLDVYAQMFDATGVKVGSEFVVNDYFYGVQTRPISAMLADGKFVTAWMSRSSNSGSSYEIYAKLFDNAGNKIGSEFLVNTYTSGDQINPSIATLSNGNFLIGWSSEAEGSDGTGVYGQMFSSSGAKVGVEFHINSYTKGTQANPVAVSLTNSGFVVAWDSYSLDSSIPSQDGSGSGIYAQRYDNNGNKVGSEFRINSDRYADQKLSFLVSSHYNQNYEYIAFYSDDGANMNGKFFTVFDKNNIKAGRIQTLEATSEYDNVLKAVSFNQDQVLVVWKNSPGENGIFGKVFNITQIATTPLPKLSTSFPVMQDVLVSEFGKYPLVKTFSNHNFLIAYNKYTVSGGSSYFQSELQVYDQNGIKLTNFAPGREIDPSAYGFSPYKLASVAELSSGGFVYAYQSRLDSNDIFYKLYDHQYNTVNIDVIANYYKGTSGTQESPSVFANSNGGFTIAWSPNSWSYVDSETFDSNGVRISNALSLSTSSSSSKITPTIIKLSNGYLAMAWVDNSLRKIYAKIYNPSSSSGSEFQVNTNTNYDVYNPTILSLSSNKFVITWENKGQDGSDSGIFGQILDITGSKVGSEFRVNTDTTGYQGMHANAVLDSDHLVTVWANVIGSGETAQYDIRGQVFYHNFTKSSNEIIINNYDGRDKAGYSSNYKGYPSVAAISNTKFIVAWEGIALDNNVVKRGIVAKIIDMDLLNKATNSQQSSSDSANSNANSHSNSGSTSSDSHNEYTIKELTTGGTYQGTSSNDNFIIDCTEDVVITGGDGDDRFTIKLHADIKITIKDFNQHTEQIDLRDFGKIASINDFTITHGSAVINLPQNQKVILENLTPADITESNFIFTPHPTAAADTVSATEEGFSIGGVVGVAVAGAAVLGAGYLVYAKTHHIWPFIAMATATVAPVIIGENGQEVIDH